MFNHLLPVLQAVRPAQLADALGAIAATLRDEGHTLRQTIGTVAHYLREFAPKVPRFVDDITRFAHVARTYSAAAPDLLQALRNFTTTNQTLARQRAQYVALLHNVTVSSRHLARFSEANEQTIITLSRDSLPTLRVVARYAPEFPCLSRALVDFIPVMDSALGAGTDQPGLHATLQVVPTRLPYTSADAPTYDASGGPHCPDVAASGTGAALSSTQGLGTQNSPQENEVIAELLARSSGTSPSAFPKWGSLLVGPALRGTAVSLR